MAVGTPSVGARASDFWKNIYIPVSLIGILIILVLPMPTPLLDVCIALNIAVSLIILFVGLYIEKPLSFSSFPALLLITTLFRLAMNVAATRLILLNGDSGHDAAGSVIRAFGEFVVGGNSVVGVVIFIVISLVNLKVITKGSGRIAEVAARFTLDAMPGKQMAIDSDLNTGIIKESEAKVRRKELQMEAEFYGAMDGAAKFVSGDAVAGIFITSINIFGGFFIGVVQKDMHWLDAATTYTLLMIGDGLVSQIPSIIISTAAGLIVSRAASGDDLGHEVFNQLAGSVKPLVFTSCVCALLSIVPGLPFFPFLTLSLITGASALVKQKSEKLIAETKKKDDVKEAADDAPKPGSTEEVSKLLGMDTLELELGFELVAMVEGGDLVERIRSIRRQFATDYGFIVPPIHIRDNVRIKSGEYRLLLKGSSIGGGELRSHHLLAMDPGTVTSPIKGIPTKEPTFGLEALWIQEGDKERAQFSGYTVVDLSTVITTHLTELVRSHMHELLGRQETQHLLDNLAKDSPKVIEELVPSLLSLGQVQQVLQRLLKEQISIRDMKSILESLADWAPITKQIEKLTEQVRRKLSRTITSKFTNSDGMLPIVNFSPSTERALQESLQSTDEGSYMALEPGQAQQLISKIQRSQERFGETGASPLVLCSGPLRPALTHFVDRFCPGVSVITHQEIAPNTRVQSLGLVNFDE